MKHYPLILIAIACIFLSSSCTRLTPFTEKLYKANNWSERELKDIQFYLSDEVVIRRQVKDASSEIISGEIKMVDGRDVDQIVLKRKTPGVLEFKVEDKPHLAVSFEEGKHFMFGPNPKRGGEYRLLASSWKNKVGKINYDDKVYYTEAGNGTAGLMVNLKKIKRLEVDTRKVKGRTVK